MRSQVALSTSEFEKVMEAFGPFEESPDIALAVSGGADSLALTLLAQRWVLPRKGKIHALTVDHGLRAESYEEAQKVGVLLHPYGISHTVLRWQGEKPTHRIQERAREIRYQLLSNWCRQHNILHLLVAHHLQDQIETVAMRLENKTNIEGLAGMSAIKELQNIRILRPFLNVPKERLTAFLEAENLSWIDDPSNQNRSFSRVRWRQALSDLPSEAALLPQISLTRIALEKWGNRFLSIFCQVFPEGYVRLERQAFQRLPFEFQAILFSRILMTVGVFTYPPRQESLKNLMDSLRKGHFRGQTCHGCMIREKGLYFYIFREPLKTEGESLLNKSEQGGSFIWDRRFKVRVPKGLFPLSLKRLGLKGWKQVRETFFHPLPFSTLVQGTPAFWHQDQVVWTPLWETSSKHSPDVLPYKNSLVFSPLYPLTHFTFSKIG